MLNMKLYLTNSSSNPTLVKRYNDTFCLRGGVVDGWADGVTFGAAGPSSDETLFDLT